MTSQELESRKTISQTFLRQAMSMKSRLEQEKTVISYLEQIQIVQAQQKYQTFLNKLEIGEDGTVFSPYESNQDRAFSQTHYGLSAVLERAFQLCYWNMKSTGIVEEDRNWITFEQLQNYIHNAYLVLTNMNYVPGDRLIKNNYQLEIYKNPKNYSVVPFNEQIASLLTEEEWKYNYYVPGVKLIEDFGFICSSLEHYKELNKENLTPREYEAFYGEKAMITLGLEPTQSNQLKKVKQPL